MKTRQILLTIPFYTGVFLLAFSMVTYLSGLIYLPASQNKELESTLGWGHGDLEVAGIFIPSATLIIGYLVALTFGSIMNSTGTAGDGPGMHILKKQEGQWIWQRNTACSYRLD